MAMKNNRRNIYSLVVLLSVLMISAWALFSGAADIRMWHSVLIGYLFFNSLAGGLVIWPSIVSAAYGKWMGRTEEICWSGLSFSVPSILILLTLWAGSGEWVPWKVPYSHAAWWIDNTFVFIRNLIMQLLFWGLAFYAYSRRFRKNFRVVASWLLVVFAFAFSLLGFDFVMSLSREFYTMMMGGYFFITAAYIGVVSLALLSVLFIKPPKNILHDLGKLIIAFCMISTYLLFSQLFPIWYENLPHEASFLVPRMNTEWKIVGYILLVLVYLGPIAFLLPVRTKKNPLLLGIITSFILLGLWIERWWLVSAVFQRREILFGVPEILPSLALLAIFGSGMLMVFPIVSRYFERGGVK